MNLISWNSVIPFSINLKKLLENFTWSLSHFFHFSILFPLFRQDSEGCSCAWPIVMPIPSQDGEKKWWRQPEIFNMAIEPNNKWMGDTSAMRERSLTRGGEKSAQWAESVNSFKCREPWTLRKTPMNEASVNKGTPDEWNPSEQWKSYEWAAGNEWLLDRQLC